ncbi:MAG: AAA family ATPase [Planctomycetes bacterium]|nr:AAA family ATPase [Planctomycetota bacterium]
MSEARDVAMALLAYLEREALAEHQKHRESRALTVEQRVEEGSCIAPVVLVEERRDGAFAFRVEDNLAKFRPGDPVWLSEGQDPEGGLALVFESYRADERIVTLTLDRFQRERRPIPRGRLAIDRRRFEGGDPLRQAVLDTFQARSGTGAKLSRLLRGKLETALHDEALARASEFASKLTLDPHQARAVAEALAAPDCYLIQGPPGTGKTRVLAHIAQALLSRGRNVLVSAFTHTAINNALLRIVAKGDVRAAYKLGREQQARELGGTSVRVIPNARSADFPKRGCLVGATCFGARKLASEIAFDVVILDEAGQVPVPHAIAAMLGAPRWILIGDHLQMRPVVQADHDESLWCGSIFAALEGRYPGTMLETTYRMNAEINAFPSHHVYGGRLEPHPDVAGRRLALRPGGRLREILDPDVPRVFCDLSHEGNPTRSFEEAHLIGELLVELVHHHGIAPDEIAVISPFRAQNRAIHSAAQEAFAREGETFDEERLVIDTVERMQGQERDVVILSLVASDESFLERKVDFYFEPGRLNVALTRARRKLILVGSRALLRMKPRELEDIRRVNFIRKLLRETVHVRLPEDASRW